MRSAFMAVPVLAALAVACGDARPGPVGGSASLVLTPESAQVLAGSGPVTLRAMVVGAPGPISWALSGPGTLGQTAGAENTYLPPASVAVDTPVVVTASAGPGLSTSVQITVSPGPALEVHGRVVGATGVPLSGLTVTIAGQSVVSDDDGRFTLPSVVPPYDVDLVLSGQTVYSARFEGLRRPDPTLVFLWLFSTGEPNTATISGTLSGGDPPGTPGEFSIAFFTTRDVRFDLASIGIPAGNDPWTLPVSWFGPGSITATVHVLQFRTGGPGQPPAEYIGYGVHEGIPLSRDAAVEDAGVALTRPGTSFVEGTILAPSGYAISSTSLGLEFDGLTSVPLGHLEGGASDFHLAVPSGIPVTAAVTATATSPGAGNTTRRLSGLDAGTSGVSIGLPVPPRPLSPEAGATGIPAGSDVTWTPFGYGVHLSVFQTLPSGPQAYVVTTATHAAVPPLPSGAQVSWLVAGFGPFEGMDDFTSGPRLFPALGSTVQGVSEVRIFRMQ